MCNTYNTIGSLTTLKSHLVRNNIHDFKSLKEVIDFQNSFTTYRQQLIFHHENLIEQEQNMLNIVLQQLDTTIEIQKWQSEKKLTDQIHELKHQLNISTAYSPTNVFKKLTQYLIHWSCRRKIKYKERNYDFEVLKSINKLIDIQKEKNNRYQFIMSRFSDAVKQSAQHPLWELERKKATIDQLSNFIYGALGEQKVAKTLEALSDSFYLINDFAVSFSTPIYNKEENDNIKSIQIDHLLVAPSGIFLIETKNWSKKSLENLSLRSPIQQIKRSSFALFKLLNNERSIYNLNLDKHHWGNKKISIKNLIVLINTKPTEAFQYVKILTLNELLGYVNYFTPIFTDIETRRIAGYLINLNNQKTIVTSRK